MNSMNNKKYKVVKTIEENYDSEFNIPKLIMQIGILSIICILAFLVAKYIVRSSIDGEKIPIDTSERI